MLVHFCHILCSYLRRDFSSPRGHHSLRDLKVPVDRIFTGWHPLSLTLPQPPSPIFGAQPLKPEPPARGSFRPQKEATLPPHPLAPRTPTPPWLSCTISTELLWGLCQAPTGWSDGASGWPWLYLSDKETRGGAQGQTHWTREECWLQSIGQLLLKDRSTSILMCLYMKYIGKCDFTSHRSIADWHR